MLTNSVSVGEAALTGGLGYGVVFVGLIALMIVVMIVGKIMSGKKKAAAPAPAAQPAAPAPVAAAPVAAPAAPTAQPAPGSAGPILLVDTKERDAALIMAIVANQMGKPLNELRFISIKKEVK